VVPAVFADDLHAGLKIGLGTYLVTRDEIVDFASMWDPQWFHTDVELAIEGHFGEVIASGLHSLAVFQRLAVMGAFQEWAIVAGREIRDVRFHRPVRPGDLLCGEITILAVLSESESRSIVRLQGRLEVEGHLVMTVETDALVSRRRPESDLTGPIDTQ
jgi:acyl dehydratase